MIPKKIVSWLRTLIRCNSDEYDVSIWFGVEGSKRSSTLVQSEDYTDDYPQQVKSEIEILSITYNKIQLN